MNLVHDAWLPFRLQDGSSKSLPITAICDPEIVDFFLPRADFQGAAYQFAIGLLQTVFAPEDQEQWEEFFEAPPDAETLQQAFDKVAHAFNVTGDGPLFMQDFDLLESAKPTTVAGLLIEAPGGNGIKLNTDHFIKRGVGEVMSLEMAALALFTLQINAPAGGVGHRVGLRGGGPLTTLVMPAQVSATLWQKLWLNVINRETWRYDEPDLHDGSVFPWLAPTRTSEKKGSEIYAHDVHPLHMYWAMPRRIRLDVEEKTAICQISGESAAQTVSVYRTQNYGANYSGTWSHPLTPYKSNPKKPDEEHLSVKGQPGGITYKIWDSLTLSSAQEGLHCAQVVSHFYELGYDCREMIGDYPRLWAFGYDMDNMKARGWYASVLPLFSLEPEQQADLVQQVKTLQNLASNALWQCRTQVKAAWFDKPGEAKGDTAFIDLAFWQQSELAFYTAVQQMVENAAQDESDLSPLQAKDWLLALRRVCLDLFDDYALSELGNERSMAKRIQARRALAGWLFGGKEIKRFITDHHIEFNKETA
ncbi:type I-E CRISPR-associated protein Cse1/CasA [Photobacterium sp. 2_MG-2023]|uniref:type I-E CRISPR-associated protein Cse1/CasA n=1 Tax=Photobacterium sp. 2_MG-2023 TaxID=3062663 RepID=UPI0026E413F8|nr:type I-E CRISPR-associated protein Cse1/CasA [Photobacterium sp. 2_MG-2023]MDO6581493.1 type I-E CRISPR-associated protein Cse1/CasA [Photobacterium sp. 2_MG-2023]